MILFKKIKQSPVKIGLFSLSLFFISGCATYTDSSLKVSLNYNEKKEIVRNKIKSNSDKYKECYFSSAKEDNYPSGRLVLKMIISPLGQVTEISRIPESTTLDSELIFECMKRILSKIKFPEITDGKEGVVIYPFLFQEK